jgi:hypothetical protein
LYYNIEHVQSFQTQSCADGYEGGTVSYTVPANKYSSIIPGEADSMALEEIAANGQAYANSPDHAVCSIDANPIWEASDLVLFQCQQVDGDGHLFQLANDVNPNSPTYGKATWQDTGPNSSCPSGPWYSDDKSGTYYNQRCDPGWSSYPTYVSMPAGSYVSNVSKQDANNQAVAAAQLIANNRVLCEGPDVYVTVGSVNTWYNDNPYFEVVFVSQASGQSYSFGSMEGYGIPAGTYDVYLNVSNSSQPYDLYICGFRSSTNNGYIYNLGVSENNCNVFNIGPYTPN